MTDKQQTNKPGFATRFLWALIRVVILVSFAVLIGWGGQVILYEMSVMRADIQQQQASGQLLRSDVNGLMATNPNRTGQQVELLAVRVAGLDEDMNNATSGLGNYTTRLAALDAQIAVLATNRVELMQNLTQITEALVALQGDLVANSGRIDTLATTVTGIDTHVATVDTAVTDLSSVTGNVTELETTLATVTAQLAVTELALASSAAELNQLQETVTLLRLHDVLSALAAEWQAEAETVDLAAGTASSKAAVGTVMALQLMAAPEMSGTLTAVDVHLAQVVTSLEADNLAGARTHLAMALAELDAVLTARLTLAVEGPVVGDGDALEATEVVTDTATISPTVAITVTTP